MVAANFGGALIHDADASDFHSPRTEALGGAGHASPLLGDSLYLNPSFTSFMQSHSLTFNYLSYGNGTIDTPIGPTAFYGHNMNLSIVDGTADSLFQAGVGYTRRDDVTMIHIGAAKHFLDRLGVGIGTKFILPNDATGTRIIEASVSCSILASSWFQASLIADNLLEAAANRGFYREFTLGTKFNIDSILLIYLDPNYVPTLPSGQSVWGYQAGVEFPFFTELFLRMGMFSGANVPYQNQRGDGFGVGLGWVGPRISIEYSFSRVTAPLSSQAHSLGVGIFF